ncbi:vacuolar protein sorting-associated protein 8 homolog [Atheta coriaria]|uniref:vacuolar protein sorting-associated protein 8 homolog n=1 Tax=Dalotia coriaria TaxID=877792 RepID=UPI0031F419F8
MGSEVEDLPFTSIEDSDDSLLDIKELNDAEFDLPSTTLPSLESILWDMESEEGSDNQSIHSLQSLTMKLKSMLYHCILNGISTQVTSAAERVGAGLPTVITNSSKYVAIGTSHGYALAFDSEQKLCWCSHDEISVDQGAISAMAFNGDSTRLLIGFERGYILMLDAINGDVLRRLPDAHAPQTAVLQLRFTASNNLALVGDSSGCVFSLNFVRRLGVRSWDSKCLFSGARGEVCCFEPLVLAQEMLGQHYIVALATLSKVIIITIKPRLKVLFSQQLPRLPSCLPLLSWQMVLVGKTHQPVLAWGRGSDLNYTRIIRTGINRNKLRLTLLRHVQLPFTMIAIHWVGNRHLAIMDTSENLRLIEVRSQKELEMLELANAGLVYNSAHFKALAVGGGVSEAFALAGERACYNSLSCRGDQLLILGTKAVHLVKLRTWHERLLYLSDQGRWAEALNLAAEEGSNREKSTVLLLDKYINSLKHSYVADRESLTAAINCCIKLNKIDILCTELWDRISTDPYEKDVYYLLITECIIGGSLTFLQPSVTQSLVAYLEQKDIELLSAVLLSLDLICLDLHQVLSICKKRKLYDAWIHITTKTIGDYTCPLTEFLHELTPENHSLGNTIIVYVSACLGGLGYPKGIIPHEEVSRVKFDILRCLQAVHSVNAKENEQSYPYLRALLKYNIRECLNVIKLAFTENEFSGEMGLLQRQRLVEILIQIVGPPEFNECQITILACFIAKLVTSNNLKVDEPTLNSVIKSLTETKHELSNRDHSEREQACLDLLHENKLGHLTNDELLKIALESRCYKVAEFVYESQKDYSNILSCYLNDQLRKGDVFNYILTHIRVSHRKIRQQFLAHFKELVAIDVRKCVDIIIEHFPNSVEEYFALIKSDDDVSFLFLSELVVSDIKMIPEMAEWHLELLCKIPEDIKVVKNYLRMGLCRIEQALEITKKYDKHEATSLLLEQMGEFKVALDLLLEHGLTESAVDLCVRGADHLSAEESQKLWLSLLKHPQSSKKLSLRELIHSAAPHVPPTQLFELVSDANFGDIKGLLQGMLADCRHDIEVYNTTLKLLGRDYHQSLAKSISLSGKGLSIQKLQCSTCQSPLYLPFVPNADEQKVSVWGCGHAFHFNCISTEETTCPFCRCEATRWNPNEPKKTKTKKTSVPHKQARPNVEGHF